jgi:hypothetical protein
MSNGLEDKEVIKDGVFVGLLSEDKVAARFGVGVGTVRTWTAMGMLSGTWINGRLYFLDNVTDPRKN